MKLEIVVKFELDAPKEITIEEVETKIKEKYPEAVIKSMEIRNLDLYKEDSE